jgi:tRNA(His) 5'-end guanylyltransferase
MQNPTTITVNSSVRVMQAAMSPAVDNTKPLVIRLRGQNILNNRADYDLVDGRLIRLFHHIGKKIAYTHTCVVYTALDTVTFIFPDPSSFLSQYREPTITAVASIFLKVFLREIWKYHPAVRFHATVFSLDRQEIISDYLHYLKTQCQREALHYYAQNVLPPREYRNETDTDLVLSLEIKKQFSKMTNNTDFYSGITSYITGM